MRRRALLLPALVLLSVPVGAWAQSTESSVRGAGIVPGSNTAGDGSRAGEPGPAPTPHPRNAASVEPAAPDTRTHSLLPTPAPPDLETRAAPVIDVHGYIRARYDLFQNYGLGWELQGSSTMSPQATPTYGMSNLPWYRSPDSTAQVCAHQPDSGPLIVAQGACANATQMSANMRLRLNPEMHPTEFLAVYSQIDLLDNLVMGSTPEGYYVQGRSTAAPLPAFATTQIAPTAGYNSNTNSIVVKRAWAEATNQNLGQIRFGRMPSHWGLGILANAGNGYDSDYQSTVDRVMYAVRVRPYGLFAALMYDWASSGPTSISGQSEPGQGQPYSLSVWDGVNQAVLAVGRRMEPEQARAAISRGDFVLNGGLYMVYRWQYLDGYNAMNGTRDCTSMYATTCGMNFVRRDAQAFIPDLWLQVLGQNFRIELEGVFIYGHLRTTDINGPQTANNGYTIAQGGVALETEYRALNGRLHVGFDAGYASGDRDIGTYNYTTGLQPQALGDTTLSLFRFHPDYRIDLIFWRQIMQQIAGAYYFRPSLGYNFIDEPGGDLFFGRVDVIWSRASEFMQTRGHHADLGVELDATLQYQTNHHRNDGTDPRPAPGFYAMLQGGVFFPLGGLGPTDQERAAGATFATFGFQTAFTVRGYVGVMF